MFKTRISFAEMLKGGPGHFPKISNFQKIVFHPFKIDQKCVQMIPNGIWETFQTMSDFFVCCC